MKRSQKYKCIIVSKKGDKQKHDKFTTMTIMNEFYTGKPVIQCSNRLSWGVHVSF